MSKEDKKRVIDWEAIEVERLNILSNGIHGREADIVNLFKLCARSENKSNQETRIPMSNLDTLACEMAFKFGRADIVVFHIDGSASVIEVKDGTKGYNHVVAGIGQAGLYASQLAINKGTLTKVRKCLLWTSTGDISLDAVIESVCESTNTIALPWGGISEHLSYYLATLKIASCEEA